MINNTTKSNFCFADKNRAILEVELNEKKETSEIDIKTLYESEQNLKIEEDRIINYDNEKDRIKKDIEENTKTSQEILTELKKIESYELDIKIKEYQKEVSVFDLLTKQSNVDEIIKSGKKIENILIGIKEVVKTIQANEYELAKKNEQIKNDIDSKISSANTRLSEIMLNFTTSKDNIKSLTSSIRVLEEKTKINSDGLNSINNKLNEIKKFLDEKTDNFHDLELNIEKKKVQINNLVEKIKFNNKELESILGNIKTLEDNNQSPDDKLKELQEILAKNLKVQNVKDLELKDIRAKITQITDEISLLEGNKSDVSSLIDNIRYEISEDEKNIQEIVGQVKITKNQLQELGFENKSILDADINYDLTKWKKRENDLANTIDRMGPINLAAIDQFREYEERKSYLTMQKDDLLTALNSLEDAIKKIDKDTKERFKDTFEKVDNKLQEIFPKLFNGGKAYLKMTENDLLKTGVAVYASPPGKKLTSINLLSGGEKALTALSLVFALFSLNPSPFCMLDEVDAPLDDANIERFCNLFSEMSEKIQFIIITHKKITMEYVEQLIGVTMGEKGVSKLVNVSMSEEL